jgi:hypothetical protein
MNNLPVARFWPSECTTFKRLEFTAEERAGRIAVDRGRQKKQYFRPNADCEDFAP